MLDNMLEHDASCIVCIDESLNFAARTREECFDGTYLSPHVREQYSDSWDLENTIWNKSKEQRANYLLQKQKATAATSTTSWRVIDPKNNRQQTR